MRLSGFICDLDGNLCQAILGKVRLHQFQGAVDTSKTSGGILKEIV